MSSSAIPLWWLHTDQLMEDSGGQDPSSPREEQAVCWGIIGEDGSCRKPAFSQGNASPGRADRGEEKASGKSPGQSSSIAGREKTGSEFKPVCESAGPVCSFWGQWGSPSASKSTGPPVSLCSEGPADPKEVGWPRQGCGLSNGSSSHPCSCKNPPAIRVGELFSSAEEGLNPPGEGHQPRPSVEMPVAKPTLEDPPLDVEELLERFTWADHKSSQSPTPGVDRRGPFEVASIDPPTATSPQVPLSPEVVVLLSCGPPKISYPLVQESCSRPDPVEAQLARVIHVWPTLPRRTREAVLAIIDLSVGKR